MRITRLQLEDRDQAPVLEAADIARGLNAIPLDADNLGDALPELLRAVLYGHGRRGRDLGAFGEVDLTAEAGRFRLRCRRQPDDSERFTIARLDGGQVPPHAIERLLCGLPVPVAERVFHANGRRGDQLSELLSEDVARVFLDLDRNRPLTQPRAEDHRDAGAHDSRAAILTRRDELARAVEDQLAGRRARSGEVEREIQQLDADAEQLLERRESVDRRRMAVEGELSALETRLRYRAISETVNRESDRHGAADLAPQLDELETQIDRWRQTLAELELRESHVRSELATIHPDDASPSITLADQRAGLAVATRLLEDLDGEVARLARAADSRACVCRDAHPRINPLVETLARQVDRLTDLADQQERAFHAQQLKAEAEHLARSRADLQRQLEHLLARRQELYRATRSKRTEQPAAIPFNDPAGARPRHELEAELADLTAELTAINDSLHRLQRKRAELDDCRAGLLSSSELDALQRELTDVQRRLSEPTTPAPYSPTPHDHRWRASELFARLTDGAWVSLRLVLNGRELAATNHAGQQRLARELSSSERRLASLALRLSLVWTAGQRGVLLPLVLCEPFAGLEPRQVNTLATVLEDFGRAGRQVFVSTCDADALARFDSLAAHRLTPAPVTTRGAYEFELINEPAAPTRPASIVVTTRAAESPEHLLSPDDSIERFPVPIRDREAVFLRSRIRTIADLLSADPSAVAEELDRDDVTAELVALWQTHLALVCFVPRLTFDDAVLLTGAGCLGPDELADADPDHLIQHAADYLRSERGARLAGRGYRFDRDTAARFVRDALCGRQRWADSPAYTGWQRHRGERRQRVAGASAPRAQADRSETSHLRIRTDRASTNGASRSHRNGSPAAKQPAAPKFHLETTSPIADAPSIGPKTAKRLEKAGVRTVADLLAADPELLAEKLGATRIDAETLVAWQHQAQLVCRIPGLRGHDAQVLVECGFTRPEELASMKPAELFGFIEPFCATPEAERILRGSNAPDLAEVTDWIRWSRQCRVLGAA